MVPGGRESIILTHSQLFAAIYAANTGGKVGTEKNYRIAIEVADRMLPILEFALDSGIPEPGIPFELIGNGAASQLPTFEKRWLA